MEDKTATSGGVVKVGEAEVGLPQAIGPSLEGLGVAGHDAIPPIDQPVLSNPISMEPESPEQNAAGDNGLKDFLRGLGGRERTAPSRGFLIKLHQKLRRRHPNAQIELKKAA